MGFSTLLFFSMAVCHNDYLAKKSIPTNVVEPDDHHHLEESLSYSLRLAEIFKGEDSNPGDKFAFIIRYKFCNIDSSPGDIYDLINRSVRQKWQVENYNQISTQSKKGTKNCLLTSILGETQDSFSTSMQFLLSQYQKAEKSKVSTFVQIEIISSSKPTLLKNALNFDNIFESLARLLKGYLKRSFGCSQCAVKLKASIFDYLNSNVDDVGIIDEDNEICDQNGHTIDSSHMEIIKTLKETGNFSDFKHFSLNEEEESKIFLDGALRLTRTSYRSKFRFRARISRPCDFERISSYLTAEHKMVKDYLYFNFLFHIEYCLDSAGTDDRNRAS